MRNLLEMEATLRIKLRKKTSNLYHREILQEKFKVSKKFGEIIEFEEVR